MSSTDKQWIDAHKWFHAIDFGDVCSPGRFAPAVPPNYTLFGFFEFIQHLQLGDAMCVDVGTMDGLGAFIMKNLGARRVVATDLAPRDTFTWGKDHLNLDIDYRTPVQALDLATELDRAGDERADVILLAGVLYHVLDPITVIAACREAIKTNGFLILETMYAFGVGAPSMSFNPLDVSISSVERANVFWRPSKTAIEGMLQLLGFQVIASVAVDTRITFLAQAKPPSQIAPVSRRIREIHERYDRYANYRERVNFSAFEHSTGPVSTVTYSGPHTDRWLYKSLYKPTVPYQPARPSASVRSELLQLALSGGIHAATSVAKLGASGRTALRRYVKGYG